MIRDYVIRIIDLPLFRAALQTEIDNGTGYAGINEGSGDPELLLDATGITPRVGNATVSIKRLDDDAYDWLVALPQTHDLGRGNPWIKEISDITWETGGLGFYESIYIANGGPELHCIIWSD